MRHEQCLAGVTGVHGAGQRGAQLSLLCALLFGFAEDPEPLCKNAGVPPEGFLIVIPAG